MQVGDNVPTYCDHELVIITTRARSESEQQRLDAARAESVVEGGDAMLDELEDAVFDDVLDDEIDELDVELATQDASPVPIAEGPLELTVEDLVEAENVDEFSQTVLCEQSRHLDSLLLEDKPGLLRRKHPTDPFRSQIVLTESLRPRLLRSTHYAMLAGHSGQTRTYETLRKVFYWPHIAADIYVTVRNCRACPLNRLKLHEHTQPLQLFPATVPLQSLAMDLLGPLTKTKRGIVSSS